jgi:hypothetical protein
VSVPVLARPPPAAAVKTVVAVVLDVVDEVLPDPEPEPA